MIQSNKFKRAPQSAAAGTYLVLARLFFVFTVFFWMVAAIPLRAFETLYQVIAGFSMTFFWPILTGGIYIALSQSYYRTHGQPHKAHAMRIALLSVFIIGIGTFIVAVRDFAAA